MWRFHFHILSPLTLSLHSKWSNLWVSRLKQKRGPFSVPEIFRINENYSCFLHPSGSLECWHSLIPSCYLYKYLIFNWIHKHSIKLFWCCGCFKNTDFLEPQVFSYLAFFFPLQLIFLIRIKILFVSTDDKFAY